MQSKDTQDLTKLDIYQKAIEVFSLSRRVVSYITNDKDILSIRRSNEKADIFANNLVMYSLELVPKIVQTENEKDLIKKLKQAQCLKRIINELDNSCVNLSHTKIQGKDFLNIIQNELSKLKTMHKKYVLSIALQV